MQDTPYSTSTVPSTSCVRARSLSDSLAMTCVMMAQIG